MVSNELYKDKDSYFGKVFKYRTTFKIILGSLFVFTGLFWMVFSFFDSGKVKANYAGLFWSIVFILCGCWLLRQWYLNRGLTIELSEDGLDITDKNLKKTRIGWNEIEEVKQKIVKYLTATQCEYTIITTDGLELHIDDAVKDVKELGQLIQSRTYEFQLPRYKKMYDEGRTISFGKLSINQLGIIKGNKNISWKDIKKIEIKDGYVHIFKGRMLRWSSTPVSEVSNFYVYSSLVNDIMEGKM